MSAVGSPPLGYQWYKDGFAIAWATNSSLVLTNLALDAGGNYSVSNPRRERHLFSLSSFILHP